MISMFMVGYLNGFIMGKAMQRSSYAGGPEIKDMSNKRVKVLKWVKQNPYHTCQEIAKACKLTIPLTNGILIALMKEEKVFRTQEHKYYI